MRKDRSPEALRRADVRRCGTLWVAGPAAPGERPAIGTGVRIRVASEPDAAAVYRAMVAAEADNPNLAWVRLEGKRLGYIAEADGEVLAYGWIARAGDTVNDLGFEVDLPVGEAWIYDCATVPAARGKGLYTALLLTMRRDFAIHQIQRGWIGTSARNWASQRGIARAGFLKFADMDWSGTHSTVYGVPGIAPELLHFAASALGDGPDPHVLPNAGIPVIEGELVVAAGQGQDDSQLVPTDLMRFRAKYGEQIFWRTLRAEPGGEVRLRCEGRGLTLPVTASFDALVDALDAIAPDIPWLDVEFSSAR